MIIIAKNITNSIETFSEIGVSILPNQSIDLLKIVPLVSSIISCNEIIDAISKNRIIINDGTSDLSSILALRYLYTGNINPVDTSGKLRVHSTPRKLGLKTIWVGCGDDPSDPHDVGHGEVIKINHNIGDALVTTKYIDFNCIDNETYIHDAHIFCSNAKFDEINACIVTRATNVVPGTNTNYNLYAGYIIIPSNGNGTIDLVDDISIHTNGLIQMPKNDLGENPLAFWNATWDATLKKYINITPAPNGDGQFNMFPVEVELAQFIHSISLLGNSAFRLGSYDSDSIGHGMRLRLIGTTIGDDHDWSMTGIISSYRKKTVYSNNVARDIKPFELNEISQYDKLIPPIPTPTPTPKIKKDKIRRSQEDKIIKPTMTKKIIPKIISNNKEDKFNKIVIIKGN